MSSPFESYNLAGLQLRNRFVRSATVGPYARMGVMTDAGIRYYQMLAENKVGLIITAMTYTSVDGQASVTQVSLSEDTAIPRHQEITDTVHKADGKIIVQLSHGGAASLCDMPLSPSGISSPYTNKPAAVMTVSDIAKVTEDFVNAAIRAKKAGYDGIQLHCGHGYLLSQFISPYFNQREDEYGGSGQNRFRLVAEIITAVRQVVGSDFPLCIKINSNAEVKDDAYEEDLMWMGKECARLGVCAIEVSGHDFTPQGRSGKHTYYLKRAAMLRKACDLPVILVGGIRTAQDIQQVLDAGIDLISMSRPFICQPDLVLQMEKGLDSQCVSCSKCFGMLRKFKDQGRLCVQHEPNSDIMA